MTIGRLLVAVALAVAAFSAPAMPTSAVAPAWMTESAMRQAFIGKRLDGHYGNGVAWTESYLPNGRLDYRERSRQAAGSWYFRDAQVFCTFYDPPHRPALAGGCWRTIQTGANCYEFYLAADDPDEAERGQSLPRWNAQAWRQEGPSTCQEKPSV